MPLPADTDASTPKYLRDKYAIVGVGETTYTRGSGKTTRAMGTFAVRAAMLDAGLKPADIDGMLSYSGNDSTPSTFIAGDLGIRLNFYMDVNGGGSSTEALIGIAIGIMEAGMCKCVAIFRSMNGYSQVRIGGTGARSAAPVNGDALHSRAYGWQSAGQMFAPTFMRHMYEYGTKPEQVAMVKVVHSEHASNNPKAFYKKRYTVDDVINSRIICKPLHLLDCCVETDNATCVIVTSAERARNLRHTPALIRGVVGRCSKPRTDMHYQHGPDLARRRLLRQGHPVAEFRRWPRGYRRRRRVRRVHLHLDAATGGLRLLQEGRGRRIRLLRHHAIGWQAAAEHLRRPSL